MLAVAMRPSAAHMDLQSLEVQAVPLAALGGVWRRGKATPALGCISIGLLRVTMASFVSSR